MLEAASKRDMDLMGFALCEARAALVLASPTEIIAVAHSRIKETGDLTSHAEMVLIREVGRTLEEMDNEARLSLSVYVTLEPV